MEKKKKSKIKQAVALSYNEEMTAPKVVASGKGKVAENIIAAAEKNTVPVYKDEKMARILGEVQVGDEIPPELYEFVAKVLIFVGDMDDLYAKTKRARKQ